MKKQLFLLAVLCALILLVPAALAGGQTNPRRPEMEESLRMIEAIRAGEVMVNDGPSVTVTGPSSFALGETPVFHAEVNDPESGVNYLFGFGFVDESRETGFVYYANTPTADQDFTMIEMYNAGEYLMWVRLYDANDTDNVLYWGWKYFTITGDSGALDRKAAEIVSECRAADEWHTALNLHDWLTHHIYYDLNYDYYGEDCIFRGFGVCDSYSKAYRLLCRTAGINVGRVVNDNHAWNILEIDGKWYQTDPTWDDPAGDFVAVSGSENHDYFCLSSFLMYMDHPSYSDGSYGFEPESLAYKTCDALDANYHVHEGLWRSFTCDYYLLDRSEEIRDIIDSGMTSFSFDISSWDTYWWLGDDGEVHGAWTGDKTFYLMAYGMSMDDWTLNDGSAVRFDVTYDASDKVLDFSLRGWAIAETGTLILPSEVSTVEAEAFRYTDATTVFLPATVTYVGPRAFACSAVRTVVILNPDILIDDTAFEDCGRLILRVPSLTQGTLPAFAEAQGALLALYE